MNTVLRLIAFVLGRQIRAEQLTYEKCGDVPAWVGRAAGNKDLAVYALESARRSAEWADAAVQQLQSKASAFLTVTLALIPLGLALTSVGYPPAAPAFGRLLSFGLLVIGDLSLIFGAMMAGLASGLVMTSGTNIARLEKPSGRFADLPAANQLSSLMAAEAHAWECSAWTSMQTATRVAADLFGARRCVIIASIFFALGTVALVIAVNGNVTQVLHPSTTP